MQNDLNAHRETDLFISGDHSLCRESFQAVRRGVLSPVMSGTTDNRRQRPFAVRQSGAAFTAALELAL